MERKLKGFTIIELMVVIAIIAMLSAIGVPAALTWIRDAKVRNANEEARLVYSAVQDYLTELEIKNVDLKVNDAVNEMTMYSCSTKASLPKPIIDYDGDGYPDDSNDKVIRSMIAEYGCFDSGAMVNGYLKDVAIDLSEALGEEFEGVWAANINMNTYTVIEAYWSPYIAGSDPTAPPTQTEVTDAAAFDSTGDQESFYAENGVIIGKFPL